MLMSKLISRAGDGDEEAWRELVRRHEALVWTVVRAHGLHGADAADASQSTWAALAEHLPRLRQPHRLSAWLVTTTRRECLRIKLRGCREVPQDNMEFPVEPEFPTGEEELLWAAFRRLSPRCRELLGLIAHAPELTYVQVSRALGLRLASIGRTRARCLEHLRRKVLLTGGGPV